MRWRKADKVIGYFPEGACGCGLDLAAAADLGVIRSYQQEDIPEPQPAVRYQHDLHQARCACGRVHVAGRPAGVPDAPLSVGPRLSAMAVYLSVFQHVPVERAQFLISDLTGGVAWLRTDEWPSASAVSSAPVTESPCRPRQRIDRLAAHRRGTARHRLAASSDR